MVIGPVGRSRGAAMILGVGIDLCEIVRVKRAMAKAAFARRVFSAGELAEGRRRGRSAALHYAACFAAKEAYFKAIGTGWGRGVAWRDVAVKSDGSGPPTLLVSGTARRVALSLGVSRAHLSLTHTGRHAAAVVILEGAGARRRSERTAGKKDRPAGRGLSSG